MKIKDKNSGPFPKIFLSKCFFLTVMFSIYFFMAFRGNATAQETSWKMIGPGDADQVSSLNVMKDSTVFLGTDIGGIYRSTDQGESWISSNIGLKNYDITTPVIQAPDNLQVLYVGTRGGFYKSYDYGMTWQNKRKGLRPVSVYELSGSIGSIAVDPLNNNVLYLGFGYRPSAAGTDGVVGRINWSAFIYKSYDGGETWKAIGQLPNPTQVRHIYCSAKFNDLVYVATDDGIFRSSDGGCKWTKVFSKPTLNMLVSTDAIQIVASCGEKGVYASSNGGQSWSLLSNGLGFKNHISGPDRYSVLAISPDQSRTLYVVNSTWGNFGGAYRSVNDGITWSFITTNLPKSWLETSNRMNAIVVDPNSPKRIYLGSSRYVYRSDNGGDTWAQLISKPVGGGWTHRGLNVFGHTRVVAVHPVEKNVILVGTTDHGMVRSDDNGISWRLSNQGMKYTNSVWDFAFCPSQPDRVYAISLNTNLKFSISVSDDKGHTWNPLISNLDENVPIYKIRNYSAKLFYVHRKKYLTRFFDDFFKITSIFRSRCR
jgi:photosystem II stability/assembly factor-like uncharacterized protein